MKKITNTIIFLATLISSTVSAEWVFAYEDGDNNWYIDYGDIKQDGDNIYVWVLHSTEYKSAVHYFHIDCAFPRFKLLTRETYSQAMGKGELIATDSKEHWHYPKKGDNTIMWTGLGIVKQSCNQRAY